jgi:hypothetical protein
MKFETYIDTLTTIFKHYKSKIDELETNINSVREDTDKKKRMGDISPAMATVLDENLDRAEKQYREAVAAEITAAQTAVQDTRRSLEGDISKFLAASTVGLDSSTLVLLNSGIMTANDLVALANENGSNVTMLRMIRDKAEKLMDKSETARLLVAQITMFCDPDMRLTIFDNATSNVHIGAGSAMLSIAESIWDEKLQRNFSDEMKATNTFQTAE